MAQDVEPIPCTASGWWDAAWAKRRRIDLDGTGLTADLADFPVLVRLDPTGTDFQPDGSDVRFISASGDVLDHEIEKWTADEAVLWVRVPTIVAGATEMIWLYHGNPGAPTPSGGAVWNADFVGVWHLHRDPSGGVGDSSLLKNDGAAAGGAMLAAGQIGDGFLFDGTGHVRIPSDGTDALSVTGTALTLEAWVRYDGQPPSSADYFTVVGRQLGADYHDAYTLVLHDDPAASLDARFQTTPFGVASPAGTMPRASWVHLAGVRDGSELRIYVDGELKNTLTAADTAISTDANDVTIGGQENLDDGTVSETFIGMIDEVRISKVTRDPSWIAATFRAGAGKLATLQPAEACR